MKKATATSQGKSRLLDVSIVVAGSGFRMAANDDLPQVYRKCRRGMCPQSSTWSSASGSCPHSITAFEAHLTLVTRGRILQDRDDLQRPRTQTRRTHGALRSRRKSYRDTEAATFNAGRARRNAFADARASAGRCRVVQALTWPDIGKYRSPLAVAARRSIYARSGIQWYPTSA